METKTITKPQLEAAMLRWYQQWREGKTMSIEECKTLPVESLAELSTNELWADLQPVTSSSN